MSELIYRCWTKATDAEPGPPRHSANWVVARRAWFYIYPDRVECGDWSIRRADVRDAVLFTARQMLIPVYILSVQTTERTYQFGFNPWVHVADHLPFPFRRERVRLGYSAFSITARFLLLAYLVYLVWRWST
jgi:hypothetical protein